MIHLRRALLIGLVSLAVALAAAQLGRTPWANRFREGRERYIREHPRPVQTAKPGNPNNRPPRPFRLGRLVAQFAGPTLLIVVPAGLTFMILRNVRRGNRGQPAERVGDGAGPA